LDKNKLDTILSQIKTIKNINKDEFSKNIKVHKEKTKTDRLKKHILNGELDAARRESAGEVVARKKDGTPWNHVKELSDAQNGLLNRINELKKQLENINLGQEDKAELIRELKEASKLLDKTEHFLPR
jgi:uncharacterized phage-associated protein